MQKRAISQNIEEFEINRLFATELEKVAIKNQSKEEYLAQIKKVELRFQGLRIKQKFINQLKIYQQLKQTSQVELEAQQFDLGKFREMLSIKAGLVYEMMVQDQRNEENEQLFRRIEAELQYLARNLNISSCVVPLYSYEQEVLRGLKDQLVLEFMNKKMEGLRMKVQEQKQKTEAILMKRESLRQALLKNKKLLTEKQKEKAPKMTEIHKIKPSWNLISVETQKNPLRQKQRAQKLSRDQDRNYQLQGLSNLLNERKNQRVEVESEYMQLLSSQQQPTFQKLLRKSAFIPPTSTQNDPQSLALQNEMLKLQKICNAIKQSKKPGQGVN